MTTQNQPRFLPTPGEWMDFWLNSYKAANRQQEQVEKLAVRWMEFGQTLRRDALEVVEAIALQGKSTKP